MLTSSILLVSLSVSRWSDLTDYYEVRQRGLAAQWFGAFSAVLEQQEAIISLIGENLLLMDQERPDEIRARLDALMNLNPDFFSGFALASPEGEVLALTSNLVDNNVINIRDIPEARDSFDYALQTDKMVLGRTYFAPRLVIPARKAIRDEHGDVLGVMTGALRVHKNEGFFSHGRILGDFHRVTILRSRDQYVQYATQDDLIENFHERPLDYDKYVRILVDRYEEEPLPSTSAQPQIAFRLDTESARGSVRGVARYNPQYEFWLISEIEDAYLIREFLNVFASYFLIMFGFQISMYLFFRHIDRVDRSRRKELVFQANHDALTQLPNRNYLLSTFSGWIQEKPHFSLMFIDLDNFKGINDSFGHSIGDGVLVELSKRLRSVTNDTELLVRHGGDEFVLLTAAASLSMEQNEQRSAALIYQACDNIQAFGMTFSPGCSIGIARFPEHGTQLDALLRASDFAMYEAKKKRNSVGIFSPSLEVHYLHRIRIEQLLRGAETRGEIFMTYQPQLDSADKLWGVEALVRWRQPELGLIPPDQFIRVAEDSGLMNRLGDYIVDQSLKEIQSLYQRTKMHFRLSINISVRQVEEEHFADKLIAKIQALDIPLGLVCLEITESLLINDRVHMRSILEELHSAGIRIALDDFGTGYSSLSMLRDLPINELKIDKSFVSDILKDDTSLKMVKNIINIGRLYNMTILAEGVETQEEMQILKDCGCDLFQGYLFSRPKPIAELEEYIRDTMATGASSI